MSAEAAAELEGIFQQVQSGDPVGAAYRLVQSLGQGADGRPFYEAGSAALARRDELGEDVLRFARIAFAEAVERDPDLADAHHDLATTMRELGMSEDAVRHYRRALELNTGDADALIGLGAALCDSGKIDEGIKTLYQAAEAHPESAHAYANLGVALEVAGRDEESASAYAKAVARYDANLMEADDDEAAADAALRRRWARIQHAAILERLERWPQAIVEFRRLYEEEQAIAEVEAEANANDDDDDDAAGEDETAGAETPAPPEPLEDGNAGETLMESADAPAASDSGDDEEDDEDDEDSAGRTGLERVFARLVQGGRHDLAYVVLDDLGGELADERTRATYAIYDPGDGLPTIMVERWDGGREKLDPRK